MMEGPALFRNLGNDPIETMKTDQGDGSFSMNSNNSSPMHRKGSNTNAGGIGETVFDDDIEGFENFTADDLLSLSSPDRSMSVDTGSFDEPAASTTTPFADGQETREPFWRVHHPGVHMHIQDNMKLPTFNLPVNRSAVRMTVNHNHHHGDERLDRTNGWERRQQQSEGLGKFHQPSTSPDHRKMTERFLSQSGRHWNHNNISVKTNFNFLPQPLKNTQSDSSEAINEDLFPDPTPLSEIKQRHETYQQCLQQQQHQNSPDQQALPHHHHQNSPDQPALQHHHHHKASSSPTAQRNIHLASPKPTQQQHIQQHAPPQAQAQPFSAPYLHRPVPLPIPTEIISPPVSPIKNGKRKIISIADPEPPSQPIQQSAVSPFLPPAAPAIHHAVAQKAKYGFGKDHVVPHVPIPPTKPSTSQPLKNNHNEPFTAAVTDSPPHSSFNNPGAAYERKKQRAKDARVKLNESIEHLSVAIDLAGNRTRERAQVIPNIGRECVELAEAAKKWDRPAFVGSAAAVIVSLNKQCDTLCQELQKKLNNDMPPHNCDRVDEQKDTTRLKDSSERTETNAATLVTETDSISSSGQSSIRFEKNGFKRLRLDLNATSNDFRPRIFAILEEPRVLRKVTHYLDPASLIHWQESSKRSYFLVDSIAEELWQGLALARFGYLNVRQWQHRAMDEDGLISWIKLYQIMNWANVMPSLFCTQGLSLLGQGRNGACAAWIFLVQRSNGEILRSVKCNDDRYVPLPVVELRIVVQNIGLQQTKVRIDLDQPITVVKHQRNRKEVLNEVKDDERFQKRLEHLNGTRGTVPAELKLFESAVLVSYINAQGCQTQTQFVHESVHFMLEPISMVIDSSSCTKKGI